MLNLSKIHSFSYNSQSFDFKLSKILMTSTGLFGMFTSHILTLKKSLENMYWPSFEKVTSLMLEMISVKKFLLI